MQTVQVQRISIFNSERKKNPLNTMWKCVGILTRLEKSHFQEQMFHSRISRMSINASWASLNRPVLAKRKKEKKPDMRIGVIFLSSIVKSSFFQKFTWMRRALRLKFIVCKTQSLDFLRSCFHRTNVALSLKPVRFLAYFNKGAHGNRSQFQYQNTERKEHVRKVHDCSHIPAAHILIYKPLRFRGVVFL